MYFPFQTQARNHMENINFERTLCHYDFLTLLIFVVAEDVSLTGGAAIQRIRLIDEEEQV